MSILDEQEGELTLRNYLSRDPEDDSVEERWVVESDNADLGWAGETPSEALRVLASSLEDEDGKAEIDELVEDDEADAGDWEVTD